MRSRDHQIPRASGSPTSRRLISADACRKNAKWLYFNGGRFTGRATRLLFYGPVLFSSFLMGEIAAATIFHRMAAACTEPVFKEGFRNIGKDEGRHGHLRR